MSAAPSTVDFLTVEEYLAAEVVAFTKHEYLAGAVHAMAGASEAHNIIAMNLYAALHRQLRGSACMAFGSDMKLRLRLAESTYYYYPDAMVACDPTDRGAGWRERPAALFEILSEETRSIDEREKRLAYLQLPSLKLYVRLEQYRPELVVERRTEEGWRAERVAGNEAWVELPEVGARLALADLYERVDLQG